MRLLDREHLLERLRKWQQNSIALDKKIILKEAADEIKRLTARVMELEAWVSALTTPIHSVTDSIDVDGPCHD